MPEILMYVIPAVLTGIFGFLIGLFNKQKERDFELAKIKSSIYNDLFESLRPALYSDYLKDKSKEEEAERFKHWQIVLRKFDKLWLYSNDQVLKAFKDMFDDYKKGDEDGYNEKVGEFVNECRKDVLQSLGKKYNSEKYRFITFNVPKDLLPDDLNRLKVE